MAQNLSKIDQHDIEVTIHIRTTDQNEGGYMYDVWLASPEQAQDSDSDDGGQCTGSFDDAIGMAQDAARTLLNKKLNK